MESNRPPSPRFLRRSRSGTPRICHVSVPEVPPLSPNLGRPSVARSKSVAKSRAASDTGALSRRPKENRESPSPRHPAHDAVRPARQSSASAWALSPGRSQPAPAAEGKRRGGGVLGFFRMKKEPSAREEAAHQLRILTSRLLQWRLANARTEVAMEAARSAAERKLFFTWLRINELRKIVTAKRILYQRRKLKLKLAQMLNPHIQLLFHWEHLAKKHLEAVAVLARVLGDVCLSLPLVEGAQGNTMSTYNYFCIAMDIIGEIEDTIGTFYSKVENVTLLFCEMVKTIHVEIESLREMVKTSKIITSLEMNEISLRANLVQVLKGGNLHQ